MNEVKISKFLSLVLRHKPEEIGLSLDANGWASVDDLIKKCTTYGKEFTREELNQVVANNDKKRFAFSEDRKKIRASQGHSIEVDLKYEAKTPPDVLFHGTATRFLNSIYNQGLKKMQRNHVHLSKDNETAMKVGSRHGKVIVLIIDAKQMCEDKHKFFLSDNEVWLTEEVPVNYIKGWMQDTQT